MSSFCKKLKKYIPNWMLNSFNYFIVQAKIQLEFQMKMNLIYIYKKKLDKIYM